MKKLAYILMAGTAIVPLAAHAQTAAKRERDPRAGAPDEIIVTAQRFEQRVQDVPLSISAIGTAEIAARGTTDLKDLQYSVPGLSTLEYGLSRQFVQLRGLATTIGSSTVGLYLDETPLGLDTQGDPINVRLFDMERVEVLRGPQATLYGQGSMGGTIRYIPAAPRLDAVGGSFDGELSTTRYGDNNARAVGVVNLPIVTDRLGVRVVAGYERIGGYIDNVTTGEKNVNSADVYTVRGTLLAKPSERLSVSLMGVYQEIRQKNQDFGVNYQTTARVPQPINDRYSLFQAKASYDLDFADLNASASYIDRRNTGAQDVTAFYVPALGLLGIPPGFVTQVSSINDSSFAIWNGEIRLASKGDSSFGWQVGALYRDAKLRSVVTTPTAPNAIPIVLAASDVAYRAKSFAIYGEVSYAFTPKLKATAGLRYFNENKTANILTTNFGASALDLGDGTFRSFNPRFNLSYAFTPNSMVFANAAKGFRSGGFNATSAGVGIPPTYDSDEVWTYEFGTKHQLFRGKLILDASVYRTEWSKVQSYIFLPTGAAAVANAGHVEGWGVDLSAMVRPIDTLSLSATYGWNNLAFTDATLDKAVGDPVDAAVRQSWSASFDYRPRLTDNANGIVRIDYQHAGSSQITLRVFGNPPVIPRPARDLVNLRVGVGIDRFEVALFATNLFNESAPNLIGPLGTISENIEQRPRVIGINVRSTF